MVDIVPDSFRYGLNFIPALRAQWHGLRFRLGRRFIEEAQLATKWALDEVSPFEKIRILNPEPVSDILDVV